MCACVFMGETLQTGKSASEFFFIFLLCVSVGEKFSPKKIQKAEEVGRHQTSL